MLPALKYPLNILAVSEKFNFSFILLCKLFVSNVLEASCVGVMYTELLSAIFTLLFKALLTVLAVKVVILLLLIKVLTAFA